MTSRSKLNITTLFIIGIIGHQVSGIDLIRDEEIQRERVEESEAD